ncbi:MAG: glycosyltransferase family 2 protein [Thermodesulfovibrionales bacterium]|jgi:glycosyltransferase involved in cell wall biosynthesis
MADVISVIIPAYNCAAYISDAVESVLSQSYQAVEIIVVDDGSTDNTAEILNQYQSNGILTCLYQVNKGPGAARNAGMSVSKGEYICFLDADDELEHDSLQKRHDVLRSHEDVMMVFTDYGLKKPDGIHIKKYLAQNNFLEYFKDSLTKKPENDFVAFNDKFIDLFYSFSPHPIWTGTVMMKKTVIGSVGYFRTDISVGEDTDYWMRIAERYKIGYLDEPTAVYNNYRSYLTRDIERYCLDRLRSLGTVSTPTYSRKKIIHRNISDTYFQLGYYYFYKKNNRRSAIKYYLSGLRYNCRNTACMKCLITSLLPHSLINKIKLLRTS